MCKSVDLPDENTFSKSSTLMEGLDEYTMGSESEGGGGISEHLTCYLTYKYNSFISFMIHIVFTNSLFIYSFM